MMTSSEHRSKKGRLVGLFAGALALTACASTGDAASVERPEAGEPSVVHTEMGDLHVEVHEVEGTTPIVFLHGVYFDRTMWDEIVSEFPDTTTIVVDMPSHGLSKDGVPQQWDMGNVADALIQVLDGLDVEACYAIGHSWGSMTILRAAVDEPERFVAVGLGNMPTAAGTEQRQRTFRRQHRALAFRGLYARQAAKALFAKTSLQRNPELSERLQRSMLQLSIDEVKQTDHAVITHVGDGREYVRRLDVPALALVGAEDYVGVSPQLDTRTVPGGHVSPLEAHDEFVAFVRDVITLPPKARLAKSQRR